MPGDEICDRLTGCKPGDDLLLCKNRAGAADRCYFFSREGYLADLIEGYAERIGNDLEEAPRTGGAFVVHDKVHHFAI